MPWNTDYRSEFVMPYTGGKNMISPITSLYIVDSLLITLTVLLGSINQIGICEDHNVCSGASCFKEH